MENDPHKRARDRLQNLGLSMSQTLEQNREGAQRYEQAGKFGRWLIRRRDPEIFRQYQLVQNIRAAVRASESVQEAKRSAYANEGQEVVIF